LEFVGAARDDGAAASADDVDRRGNGAFRAREWP
jgi:hypothetical protein